MKLIGYITTFETLTHAHVKDLFVDELGILIFVVKEGDSGKAIGKQGIHIKKMSYLFKKNIKVIEYNTDVATFIKNIIYPLTPDTIDIHDDTILVKVADVSVRAKLIGRNRRNLNQLNTLVEKYFHSHVKVA